MDSCWPHWSNAMTAIPRREMGAPTIVSLKCAGGVMKVSPVGVKPDAVTVSWTQRKSVTLF